MAESDTSKENQLLFRLPAERIWLPVTVTAVARPAESMPRSSTVVTRPPHSPRPSRPVISRERRAPTAGNADWICPAVIVADQRCAVEPTMPSHGSCRARVYDVPPSAVHPPLDEENSELMVRPPLWRTTFAVASTAALVEADSDSVRVPFTQVR